MCLGPGLGPGFSDQPTRWHVTPTGPASVSLSCDFIPDFSSPLVLQSQPPPAVLAVLSNDRSVYASLGARGPESQFIIEQSFAAGEVSLRSVSTGLLVSADHHGLVADRKEKRLWETFRYQTFDN